MGLNSLNHSCGATLASSISPDYDDLPIFKGDRISSRDIEAYYKGDSQKRYFNLMKWDFICVAVAAPGFFLELLLHWPIGSDLATVAILANFGLVITALRNVWSGR